MIHFLNQLNIREFGTVTSSQNQPQELTESSTVPLVMGTTLLFRSVGATRICNRTEMTVLSVSADGEKYLDFYLDKAVTLFPGIYYSLSTMHSASTVLVTAEQPPESLGSRPSSDSFLVKRKIQLTNLYTFFYQEREPGFVFPGESHPVLELTYVDHGSLHSVVDGCDTLLQKGDMALYGPNQWHMQYADIGIAPRFVTVSFDISGCDMSHLFNRKIQSPGAAALLRQILKELDGQSPYSSDMVLNLLSSLIITLLREAAVPTKPQILPHSYNSENAIVQKAQKYITDHVRERLSVPEVAEGIHISSSYLTSLFHKHLSISPGEYIRRIKLQESKQLIREGAMNFTEISMALQYSTVHHFSRQFKEKFGMTPSEYAKSVK